jgi:hypothetical protein
MFDFSHDHAFHCYSVMANIDEEFDMKKTMFTCLTFIFFPQLIYLFTKYQAMCNNTCFTFKQLEFCIVVHY